MQKFQWCKNVYTIKSTVVWNLRDGLLYSLNFPMLYWFLGLIETPIKVTQWVKFDIFICIIDISTICIYLSKGLTTIPDFEGHCSLRSLKTALLRGKPFKNAQNSNLPLKWCSSCLHKNIKKVILPFWLSQP